MVRQTFNVEHYWRVIVYYNVSYGSFGVVGRELLNKGASLKMTTGLRNTLLSGEAKAATFSNIGEHISIVLFGFHNTRIDYINSLVHEAEHVKQAMLDAYDVEDSGESPAYTIGYLVARMWEVFGKMKEGTSQPLP